MQLIKISASLLIVALAVASSGCAVTYVEPTDKSVARIDFVNDTSEKMVVQFYGDAKECTNRANAGFVQPASRRTVVVPAGKELAVTFGINTNSSGSKAAALGGAAGATGFLLFAKSNRGCMPTIDFNPEVGRTYSFRMNASGGDCAYQLVTEPSASLGSGKAEALEFTVRKWITPFGESGPFCERK